MNHHEYVRQNERAYFKAKFNKDGTYKAGGPTNSEGNLVSTPWYPHIQSDGTPAPVGKRDNLPASRRATDGR